MIKKSTARLKGIFLTQDKYISHDKHLNPSFSNPGDDIIIVILYQLCHQQWTHVKGKKQSYNHLSNIYLLVLSTQCQKYNQRGTVKLFDCDLDSSRNETFKMFLLSSTGIETILNVLSCGVCDSMRGTQLTWPSWASYSIVIHLLQYE